LWNYSYDRFIESTPIRTIVIIAIILNAVLVGMYADQNISQSAYDYLDYFFVGFFCVEMAMKLFAYYGDYILA